jgi:hypothetical protein
MNDRASHRSQAEDALVNAQRNPVLSAEQSFLSAQVHALLALESRLEEVVIALRDVQSSPTVAPRVINGQRGRATPLPVRRAVHHDEMGYALERAADDGWPDGAMYDDVIGSEMVR